VVRERSATFLAEPSQHVEHARRHKKVDLAGTALEALNYPMLETQNEWLVHGFSYANYLAELGADAQSEIYKKSSVDLALRDAFRKMRRFLMTTKKLSEDEAISLMTIAVDFGVTQVVDGNWGAHAVIRKDLFSGARAPRRRPAPGLAGSLAARRVPEDAPAYRAIRAPAIPRSSSPGCGCGISRTARSANGSASACLSCSRPCMVDLMSLDPRSVPPSACESGH
jgi:hypothetical protein